jgi:hypothetical protein
MSVLNIPVGVLPKPRSKGVVCNLQQPLTRFSLRSGEVSRVNGDNRWRLIICHRGEVQALKEAEVEISASLKTQPYRGDYVFYP